MTQEEKPNLHPKWIDPHAYKIVKSLQENGFTTYLVGGCVRDLLLGINPKDYDIATDAKPYQIRKLIPHAYIIGKRFRLVLVKRADQQYEVSTFRRDIREDEAPEDMPAGDNIFGSIQEDAQRRDFTINGLFYDPLRDKVIDFASGREDLDSGLIRMIGEPDVRLLEDPIRILRAVRLTHKIRFSLETELRQSIQRNAHLLADSVLPRRREELLKFLRLKEPALPLLDCYDLGLLKYISPALQEIFDDPHAHEEFLRYMRNYHDHSLDRESPVELFAGLVLAVVRSHFWPDPKKPLRAKEMLENESLKNFMKNELGMFNQEQALVTRALQMQVLLSKPKEFEKRGGRRQLAVIRADAFPLALLMAQRDYSLDIEDLHYWQVKLRERERLQPNQAKDPQRAQRKRRRRRKKSGSRGK